MEISQEQINRYKTACSLTTKAVSKSRATERGLILGEILDLINSERIGTKYQPLNIKALGVMLSKFDVSSLYFVKQEGMKYKRTSGSFSKYFFGSLKVK